MFGAPKLVLILSGKRKSGKDYVTETLQKKFQDFCVVLRLSGPLKEQYAKENGLNYEQLLDASQYKEKFRRDMILWGENKRKEDSSYFCRHAITQSSAKDKLIWIVSDARRTTDLEFFTTTFPQAVKTIRVIASLETRSQREWSFTLGVDDAESECGLDDATAWDFEIYNNHSEEEYEKSIQPVVSLIQSAINN